jgi:purine-binding chemotaxis protein CheW
MLKAEGTDQIVTFLIKDQRFGIRLSEIKQIIRAVEITSIPNALSTICGIIDIHGVVVPVMNLHVRTGLGDRPTKISDRFIITSASSRVVALRVDEINEIIYNADEYFVNAETISSELDIHGIIRSKDGLILIYDLETFLTGDEIFFLDLLNENTLPTLT